MNCAICDAPAEFVIWEQDLCQQHATEWKQDPVFAWGTLGLREESTVEDFERVYMAATEKWIRAKRAGRAA